MLEGTGSWHQWISVLGIYDKSIRGRMANFVLSTWQTFHNGEETETSNPSIILKGISFKLDLTFYDETSLL